MNYQDKYNNLIEYRKLNIINKGYYEEHHIKPKCFFKDGTPLEEMNNDNLVKLKASEHFKAHYYLFMMYLETEYKYRCEYMFGSFKLVLDKVYLYDIDYIEECSKLYEKGRIEYLSLMEKEGLNKIGLICDWIDKHNINPKKHSSIKDENELMLGRKLASLKRAKKGTKDLLFCDSYQKLVEERGYPDLFITRTPEEKGLNDIKLICEFIDKEGKEPSQHSKDKNEKELGRILVKQRINKRNKVAFFDSYEKIVNNLDYPDLFKLYDREKSIKDTIKDICKWIDDYDDFPKRKDKRKYCNISDEENSLALVLNNLSDGKMYKDKGILFYKEYDKIAYECGYPYLFCERRIFTEIIKIRKLIKLIKDCGFPKSTEDINNYMLLKRITKNKKQTNIKEYNELYNELIVITQKT